MNRNIKITNTTKESTNHLRQVPLFLEDRPDTHLATYAENVYVGGRKALTEGKFVRSTRSRSTAQPTTRSISK